MLKDLFKYHYFSILLLLSCCGLYFSFSYDLNRTDFPKLLTLYLGLFFLSWKLVQLKRNQVKFLLAAAVVFRLIFLFSIPNLSQDFYRFLWDGYLMLQGVNPYLFTSEEVLAQDMATIPKASELLDGMGGLSAGNFSNYPPLNQLLFSIAAFFSGGSILGGVIIIRLILILSDLGVFMIGRKLLKALHLPEERIFWYLLNPFIIIELAGNLHFEGVMVFLLLGALYLLHKGRWILSALLLSLSISVKLIPLLFLPLFYHFFTTGRKETSPLGLGKLLTYYVIVGALTLASFLPFFSPAFLSNYLDTVSLWFQNFEFNASIYYVIRWIGYEMVGYNIIGEAGRILAVLVLLIVLNFSFLKRNRHFKGLLTSMLFSICVYFFLATTVHPWYLVTPLVLSIFTRYRFMLLWSVLVVLSYFAYSNPAYQENLWLVGLEYLLLFGFLGYEVFNGSSRITLKKVSQSRLSEDK